MRSILNKNWQDYSSLLDIPEGVYGSVKVKHVHIEPGEKLPVTSSREAILTGKSYREVKFPKGAIFHSIADKDGIWMQDIPIEQEQQKRAIRNFHGSVLIGGLGIGMAATMLCKNPNVDKVVVVEKDKNVIKAVAEYLLRKEDEIEERKKLSVVHSDLFKYLENIKCQKGKQTFDFAFYDIWRSDGEGTFFDTVVPLRMLSGCVNQVHNWNEDLMRGQLFFSITSRPAHYELEEDKEKKAKVKKFLTEFTDVRKKICYFQNWTVPYFNWYFQYKDKLSKQEFQNITTVFGREYVRLVGLHKTWLQEWLVEIDALGFPLKNPSSYIDKMNKSLKIEKYLKNK